MKHYFKNNTIIAFENEPAQHDGEAFSLHLDLRMCFADILSMADIRAIENDEDYESDENVTADDLLSYLPQSKQDEYNSFKLQSLKAQKQSELQSNIANAFAKPRKVLANREIYLGCTTKIQDNLKDLKAYAEIKFKRNGNGIDESNFSFPYFKYDSKQYDDSFIEAVATVDWTEIVEIIDEVAENRLAVEYQQAQKQALIEACETESDYNNLDLSIV
jgi:hypothetical protein